MFEKKGGVSEVGKWKKLFPNWRIGFWREKAVPKSFVKLTKGFREAPERKGANSLNQKVRSLMTKGISLKLLRRYLTAKVHSLKRKGISLEPLGTSLKPKGIYLKRKGTSLKSLGISLL